MFYLQRCDFCLSIVKMSLQINKKEIHMSEEAHSISLLAPVVLLTAAVIAVPLFKRIGLGSVLGYLIAGLVIGPFGLAFFQIRPPFCILPNWVL